MIPSDWSSLACVVSGESEGFILSACLDSKVFMKPLNVPVQYVNSIAPVLVADYQYTCLCIHKYSLDILVSNW